MTAYVTILGFVCGKLSNLTIKYKVVNNQGICNEFHSHENLQSQVQEDNAD